MRYGLPQAAESGSLSSPQRVDCELENSINSEEMNPGIFGQLVLEAIATIAPDNLMAFLLCPDH